MAKTDDKPQVVMDITQDPYQLLGQLGISGRTGASPRIDISSVVGADLSRLDMPHMLEVLRSVYERKGDKLIYRPRAFRVSTQAGTLTDIQANMFKRFRTDQEEINRLLDLLTPLIPDADKEDCDAIRELVRDDIHELVEEAGWLGGPRKFKMDEAFRKCEGHLFQLEKIFGLEEKNINTLSEAENWSRIVTIEELVTGLETVYENLYSYLNRGGSSESFGNQVIWLSRTLNTIKEASVRLQFQLRARFVGPDELATKNFQRQSITVAELLDWTVEVCDRGALISTRTGRSGLGSLGTDLDNLQVIYRDLIKPAKVDIPEMDDGQIQNTINSILKAIVEAKKITASSGRPPITIVKNTIAIRPKEAKAGEQVLLYVYGPELKRVRDTELPLTLISGANKISATRFEKIHGKNTFRYTIDLGKYPVGAYDLVIKRSDGTEILRIDKGFDIK